MGIGPVMGESVDWFLCDGGLRHGGVGWAHWVWAVCRWGSVGRGRGVGWNWAGPRNFRMMLLWLLAAMAGVLFVEGGLAIGLCLHPICLHPH